MVINPYTFLPLEGTVQRGEPAGHHMLGPGRYNSGRPGARGEVAAAHRTIGKREPQPPRAISEDDLERPTICHGSSIAGAVRAVHEAMTNSCLLAVDTDYRAVHQHAANRKYTEKLLNY